MGLMVKCKNKDCKNMAWETGTPKDCQHCNKELCEECCDKVREQVPKMYETVLDVLDNNSGMCLDEDSVRKILAKELVEEITKKKFFLFFSADEIEELERNGVDTTELDNDGQIVIYTGKYKWKDGSIHDAPEIPEGGC